jgi:hypothetical protein
VHFSFPDPGAALGARHHLVAQLEEHRTRSPYRTWWHAISAESLPVGP